MQVLLDLFEAEHFLDGLVVEHHFKVAFALKIANLRVVDAFDVIGVSALRNRPDTVLLRSSSCLVCRTDFRLFNRDVFLDLVQDNHSVWLLHEHLFNLALLDLFVLPGCELVDERPVLKLDSHEHGKSHVQHIHKLLVPLECLGAVAVAHGPARHQVEDADGTDGTKGCRDEKEPAEVRNQRYSH